MSRDKVKIPKFKELHNIDKRVAEATKIREKFPERIPVIVENNQKSNLPNIDKCKFLVPKDLTVGQFIYVVRKRIALKPETAMFIFVGNTLPVSGKLMSELYQEHKDPDGFLYMIYSGENTFG